MKGILEEALLRRTRDADWRESWRKKGKMSRRVELVLGKENYAAAFSALAKMYCFHIKLSRMEGECDRMFFREIPIKSITQLFLSPNRFRTTRKSKQDQTPDELLLECKIQNSPTLFSARIGNRSRLMAFPAVELGEKRSNEGEFEPTNEF